MKSANGGEVMSDITQSEFVFDAGINDFEANVINASMEKPIIVDFWAPWCGPCKQLGPALEDAVIKQNGKVLMAKVNIDENPELAGMLRIQSVPTIYAFFQGNPVDGFAGMQPPSKINEFVNKLVQMGRQANPDSLDLESALVRTKELFSTEQYKEVIALCEVILQEDKNNMEAFAYLVRSHIADNNIERAMSVFSSASAEIKNSHIFKELETAIELASEKSKLDSIDVSKLEKRVSDNPNDLDVKFDLSMVYFADNRKDEAADQLLAIISANKDWNDGKARSRLLKFFEAWGQSDNSTVKARKKLSTVLFS